MKTIQGNEKYEISEDGRIFNTKIGREIKQSESFSGGKRVGYKCVTLINGIHDGKPYYSKRFYVHRLVLIAHKGLEAGKPWVNHIDGNKSNNHINNLEWTTISDNIKHAFKTGLKKIPSGQENWNYGSKHTQETKKLQSQAKIGQKHPKYKGHYLCKGQIFHSSIAAAKALNTYPKQILRWVKSPKHPDFIFVPLNK